MKQIETWDDIWKKTDEKKIEQWRGMSDLIFPSIVREIGEVRGRYILEAGCGSGMVSIDLAKKGSKVFLLDSSRTALYLTERIKKEMRVDTIPICGSVDKLPFKNNSFDIVWNGGVLEHFLPEEQNEIINEMNRICRVRGKLIILVPYACAFFYRIGKYFAEKYGRWEYGYEKPLKTLKTFFHGNQASIIKEYDIAFEISVGYIIYLPLSNFIRVWLKKFLLKSKKLLSHIFKGYLLITVAVKS